MLRKIMIIFFTLIAVMGVFLYFTGNDKNDLIVSAIMIDAGAGGIYFFGSRK